MKIKRSCPKPVSTPHAFFLEAGIPGGVNAIEEDVLIYHKMQDHLIDLLPEKEASWQLFLKDPSLFKTFFQDYEQLAQAQQLAYIAYSRRIDHKRRCVGSTDAGHEKIIHLLGEIITTTPQDNDNGLFALAVIGLLVFVLVLLIKQSK